MSARVIVLALAALTVAVPARARLACPTGLFVVHAGERPVVGATGTYDLVRVVSDGAGRIRIGIPGACPAARARVRGRHLRATWAASRCGSPGRVKLEVVLDPSCEVLRGRVRQARRPVVRFAAARCGDDGVVTAEAGEQCAAADTCGRTSACVDCRCVAPVSLTRELQPIFVENCLTAACHEGRNPTGGFALTPETAAVALRTGYSRSGICAGQPLVVPGDPDASVLFARVAGTGCGGRMPLGPIPLAPQVVDAIRAWIAQGAVID